MSMCASQRFGGANKFSRCTTAKGVARCCTGFSGTRSWRAGVARDAKDLAITETPHSKVLRLLDAGLKDYLHDEDLSTAVVEMIRGNLDGELGSKTMVEGQGTWEVFYAPHIARLSSTLLTKFDPIRYRLEGEELFSYVQYDQALLGTGWLCAAGRLRTKDATTVEVEFDRFWVDVGQDVPREDVAAAGGTSFMDNAIGTLGRAAFFPQFASFPVLYLDHDLAVFQFPPLESNIAVRRV